MTGRPSSPVLRVSPQAPEGTILPGIEPNGFLVKGRRGWYTCDVQRRECSCPDYQYRHAREQSYCRHLQLLVEYLKTPPAGPSSAGPIQGRTITTMAIKPQFLVNLRGKEYALFAGVLDAATQAGLRSLCTTIVQLPVAENGHMAVVMARAEFKDGRVFADVGDASPQNTSSQIATAVLRLASTRAAGRALRWAINCGATLIEELPDHGEKTVSPSVPASARPRPVAAPTPAATARSAPISRPVAAAVAGNGRGVDSPAGAGREARRTPPEVAPPAHGPQTVCSWAGCRAPLTLGQVMLSQRHYGRLLCPAHQTAMKRELAARSA